MIAIKLLFTLAREKKLFMKKLSLTFSFEEYDLINELNDEDKTLLSKAIEASKLAYAPYSHFKVGAAVLLENGKIFTGNNQENAAYPSGLCAERVAVFAAASHFPDIAVKALAITAKAKDFSIDSPIYPCGACRQTFAEYEHHHKKNIRVIVMGEKGKIQIFESIESLLPFMFVEDNLKK